MVDGGVAGGVGAGHAAVPQPRAPPLRPGAVRGGGGGVDGGHGSHLTHINHIQ